MTILLNSKMCDPNGFDQDQQVTLLCYAYNHKKHQAFTLMVKEFPEMIDPNQCNKDGTTVYGTLFIHSILPFYKLELFYPEEKMHELVENLGGRIDYNKSQINLNFSEKKLYTPIYVYIRKDCDLESQTFEEMQQKPAWRLRFGYEQMFQIRNSDEV